MFHLAFRIVVDRFHDRLKALVASPFASTNKQFIRTAAEPADLIERREVPRCLGVGIVPGRALVHGAH
jgi:hypothetical protein